MITDETVLPIVIVIFVITLVVILYLKNKIEKGTDDKEE
jgi:hypothetical protein